MITHAIQKLFLFILLQYIKIKTSTHKKGYLTCVVFLTGADVRVIPAFCNCNTIQGLKTK
jgi:hypothetical protein